jgi:hypothetical protein
MKIVDNDTPEGGASPARIVTPDTRDQTTPDPKGSVAISLARVAAPILQVCVDGEKMRKSDTQPISPGSATSRTSAASIGTVSVKDKIRQLEERVKATAST